MAKKPEGTLTPQSPAGRLSLDQVVGTEDRAIRGTRDTPLPLKAPVSGHDTSTAAFDASTFDAAAFQTGNKLPPRVSNAVLDGIGAPPSAGAAPSETRLEARTTAAFAGAAASPPTLM
jgi:hypothetical protein